MFKGKKTKNLKTKSIAILSVIVLSIVIMSSGIQEAWAVRISLKRVVFEGPHRTEALTLINNTNKEQIYRLDWRRYEMLQDKGLKHIEENSDSLDGIKWADSMVTFAPRRLTIPPGASRQVRMFLRRPSNLDEGEYRAHLWINTETPPEPFEPEAEGDERNIIRLSMNPGVSMPVFVRHGNLDAKVSITDSKFYKDEESGLYKVDMVVHREGNRSIYGDFDFICTSGDKDLVIKQSRGWAVYTELDHRNLQFKVEIPDENVASCQKMDVSYRSKPEDAQFKGEVMAKASLGL